MGKKITYLPEASIFLSEQISVDKLPSICTNRIWGGGGDRTLETTIYRHRTLETTIYRHRTLETTIYRHRTLETTIYRHRTLEIIYWHRTLETTIYRHRTLETTIYWHRKLETTIYWHRTLETTIYWHRTLETTVYWYRTLETTIYRQQRLDHYHTKCTVTIRDLLIRIRTRSTGNELQGPNLSECGMWLKVVMKSTATFTLGQNFKMESPRYTVLCTKQRCSVLGTFLTDILITDQRLNTAHFSETWFSSRMRRYEPALICFWISHRYFLCLNVH
jgi:hypothetical protein